MSKQIKTPFACLERCIKSYIMRKSALMQTAVVWVGLIEWTRAINESTLSGDTHEQSVQTFTGDLTAIFSQQLCIRGSLYCLIPHLLGLVCSVLFHVWGTRAPGVAFKPWHEYLEILIEKHICTIHIWPDFHIYFLHFPEKDCPSVWAASRVDRSPQLPRWQLKQYLHRTQTC